jgi:hypothetical protein
VEKFGQVSDPGYIETSEDDEVSIQDTLCHASPPTPNRYIKQNKSAHGKVAYVIYAGNDVGVFYNW